MAVDSRGCELLATLLTRITKLGRFHPATERVRKELQRHMNWNATQIAALRGALREYGMYFDEERSES